ncbi:bacterial proteasome activator family protein [Arthrobacter castelli]|uniref:bacterial proteasome activator family protein n=1 Tax=Arthrobacter castelli TaxID=271431 RepID=UPI0003FAEC6E|nr:bacterial proteasome activator family protein [Arthrobacter castelli]
MSDEHTDGSAARPGSDAAAENTGEDPQSNVAGMVSEESEAGVAGADVEISDSDEGSEAGEGKGGRPPKLHELVDEPAKVMRIGTMIRQLLEEVRSAPLDDKARGRLVEIHERSVRELEDGLAPELVDELHRINLPFSDDDRPSDAELRVAQAQLVGWLEGLFHGIQTAIAAQQMANQQVEQRVQMRQLPPGTMIAPGVVIGENGEPTRADPNKQDEDRHHRPGQYL